MKTFKITESYTGYVEYEIKANNEEEAIKLYENDIDNCTETSDDNTDRHNYKFYSIESNE